MCFIKALLAGNAVYVGIIRRGFLLWVVRNGMRRLFSLKCGLIMMSGNFC